LSCALMAATLSVPAFAVDKGNHSQKGSLLVFPKIDVSEGRETLVRIENGFFRPVLVQCYWQNGTKYNESFQFELSANEPKLIFASQYFPTSVGPNPLPAPNGEDYTHVGELKCWAVTKDGTDKLSWNHLMGTATIVDVPSNTSWAYTAAAFRCLANLTEGALCDEAGGLPGRLALDGTEYEYCASKLSIGFSPKGSVRGAFGQSDLTVSGCTQDFRQDATPHYTKLQFDVWNANENRFDGAYQCIDSWWETPLDLIKHNPENFSFGKLGTDWARFEVRGVASTQCTVTTENVGLVGVLATQTLLNPTGPYPFTVSGTNLVGFGQIAGSIDWDPQEVAPQQPQH